MDASLQRNCIKPMSSLERREPALREAERFFELIAEGEEITFQWFGEGGANIRPGICHGHFDDCADRLAELNSRGAGIFWMVNAGDGKGRSAENVNRVRALFVDLDGAPLEPVLKSKAQPHIITETSKGHYHAYWNVDIPVSKFSELQKRLAGKLGGDPVVHDLCRVLRVPGFYNLKGEPFLCKILDI